MTLAFIGIGANLENPLQQVKKAFSVLADQFQLVSHSSCYITEPVGVDDQPSYINAVASIETSLAPEALMEALLQIEADMGRERKGVPWGEARAMDLDLLLYGDEVKDSPTLRVPHPRMHERAFVLVPLYEIAPELMLPDGRRMVDLVKQPEVMAQKIKCIEDVAVL